LAQAYQLTVHICSLRAGRHPETKSGIPFPSNFMIMAIFWLLVVPFSAMAAEDRTVYVRKAIDHRGGLADIEGRSDSQGLDAQTPESFDDMLMEKPKSVTHSHKSKAMVDGMAQRIGNEVPEATGVRDADQAELATMSKHVRPTDIENDEDKASFDDMLMEKPKSVTNSHKSKAATDIEHDEDKASFDDLLMEKPKSVTNSHKSKAATDMENDEDKASFDDLRMEKPKSVTNSQELDEERPETAAYSHEAMDGMAQKINSHLARKSYKESAFTGDVDDDDYEKKMVHKNTANVVTYVTKGSHAKKEHQDEDEDVQPEDRSRMHRLHDAQKVVTYVSTGKTKPKVRPSFGTDELFSKKNTFIDKGRSLAKGQQFSTHGTHGQANTKPASASHDVSASASDGQANTQPASASHDVSASASDGQANTQPAPASHDVSASASDQQMSPTGEHNESEKVDSLVKILRKQRMAARENALKASETAKLLSAALSKAN